MVAEVRQSRQSEEASAIRRGHLRHSNPGCPGIARLRQGEGWRYVDPRGRTIRNADVLRRIQGLVIPPAWTHVWICPDARGHIQATGRDARGRTQYRYHADWRAVRDENKFHRTLAFAQALPRIRRAVNRDLARPGLDRFKVLAAVVRLLETTLVRIGNDSYARENHSFGLTTLQRRHVRVGSHSDVHFHFRGKSGRFHKIDFTDPRLARIVTRLRDLPGQHLFHYRNGEGQTHRIGSAEVNEYIHRIAGEEFSAKDFRTWAGTVLAALALREFEPFRNGREAKRNVVAAVARAAEKLGNTPAICRKSYVHPEIIGGYLDGSAREGLLRESEAKVRGALRGLSAGEWAVLAFLNRRAGAN